MSPFSRMPGVLFQQVQILCGGLILGLMVAQFATAAEVTTVVVPIPSPLESDSAKRIRTIVKEAVEKIEASQKARDARDRVPARVILDFNPVLRPFVSEFGPAYDLAQSLRAIKNSHGAIIQGWIHGEVRANGVLVALACDNLFLSKESRIGRVVDGQASQVTPTMKSAYEEIARGRYSIAVVRKLYDSAVAVVKAKGPNPREAYVDQVAEPQGEVVLPAGTEGWLDVSMAKNLGLAQSETCDSLEELAAILHLPRKSLEQSFLRTEETSAIRIVVSGRVDARLVERVKRRISKAVGKAFNTIIFDFQCGGGDVNAALELAGYIRGIADPGRQNPILTVAWISPQARDLVLPMALACSRILMHEQGYLGDLDALVVTKPLQDRLQKLLEELLQARKFSPEEAVLMSKAWLDPGVRLAIAIPKAGGQTVIVDGSTLQDLKAMKLDLMLKPAMPEDENKPWKLSAALATDNRVGIATALFADLDTALSSEGINPSGTPVSGTDWMDDLADFLSHPFTRVILVMIGITCMILEVKVPGASLPGILAAICFVLFFWSNSQLAGQMTWLAVLLFALGLVLILMEIFIIPGFGVTGLSGILLILGSLGLVAYGHWPRNTDEWGQLARVMGPFALSGVGSIFLSMLLARFLPSLPVTNRLIIESESGDLGVVPVTMFDGLRPEDLLGSVGTTVTSLHPSGKARVGPHWLDVMSDGGFIEQGQKVRIIEVEGNRIVVKREV